MPPAAEAENGAADRVSREDDSRDAAIELLVGEEAGPAEVVSRSRPYHSVWMLLGGCGWTCATRGFSMWRGKLSR